MAENKLTAPMLQAAQLLADGHLIQDVIVAIWGVTRDSDRAAYERARRKLAKWQADPAWQEQHKRALQASVAPLIGRAVKKIGDQIEHDNPWVAQGAAREALSRFGASAFGADDKSVTVRVEGMPTLGVPGAGAMDDNAT